MQQRFTNVFGWYRRVKISSGDAYGHWIAPSGEIHEVPYESHQTVAENLGYKGYTGAFEAGYVRTAGPYTTAYNASVLSIQIPKKGKCITPQQYTVLENMINKGFLQARKNESIVVFKIRIETASYEALGDELLAPAAKKLLQSKVKSK